MALFIRCGFAAVLATAFAISATPVTQAEPATPGQGDPFFIEYMTSVFDPATSESGARAIIPLAHQVCDARAQGQSYLQAAHLVFSGGGVDELGTSFGSVSGEEGGALNIVEAATLAYCPKYNNGNW